MQLVGLRPEMATVPPLGMETQVPPHKLLAAQGEAAPFPQAVGCFSQQSVVAHGAQHSEYEPQAVGLAELAQQPDD